MNNQEYVRYIRSPELTVKYANGMRDIFGRELHTYHEIFFFIHGDADFIFSEGRVHLQPGTAVVIPKETFHQFINNGPDTDYCRCVLNFDAVSQLEGLIARKLRQVLLICADWMEALFRQMVDLFAASYSKEDTLILVKALFARLLVEFDESQPSIQPDRSVQPLAKQVMDYINQNITRPLTVTALAARFHTSPSHLAHLFRQEWNVSPHQYLLQKRLTIAAKRIADGQAATVAARESGFGDYSNFYRQYLNRFGRPPSR